MSSIKHIVWITPGFSAGKEDDSCIPPLLDMALELAKDPTVKLSIIALQYPYSNTPYNVYGASVYPLNGQNKWLRKFGIWKKAKQLLQQLNGVYPVTAVHSFWLGEAALIGQAFTKGSNIPHICTLMGQDVLADNRYIKNKRWNGMTTIALSQFHAMIYKKNSGHTVDQIIPFGLLNREVYTREMGWTEEAPVKKNYDIIGVGSLVRIKNFEMWIGIIEEVKKSYPKVKAIIVGDGPEKEDLKDLVKQKKLEGCIQFLGKLSRKETLDRIAESRMLLHTSRHEGQGMIFLEAMYHQLPIFTTPVGYSLENEKIWKGTSIAAYAEEIELAIRNNLSRIKYSIPSMSETVKAYLNLYQGKK